MKFVKNILGFNSPYSWVKWLRMAAVFIALMILIFMSPLIFQAGLIGLVIFILIFGPTLAVFIGISMLAGAIIGAFLSGRKQSKSLKESAATGSSEIVNLDKMRIKVQMIDLIYYITIGLAVFFGIIVLFSSESTLFSIIYFIFAGILIFVFHNLKSPFVKKYKDSFKEEIVKKSLANILENMEFEPTKTLDRTIVDNSGLFGKYNEYSGNDYLSARYQDTNFVQSDIHLQFKRKENYIDSNGETQTRIVYDNIFKGRLMIFDYDIISEEAVFVYDKSLRNGNIPETELDAFNKKFNIVAKDATEAFRVLTPQVLEGIVLASEKLKNPISISFKNDKIYLSITGIDAFEAVVSGDITLIEQRKQVLSDIQIVLDMIENIYHKNRNGQVQNNEA